MTGKQRHWSSPQEMVSAFRNAARDASDLRVQSRTWREVHYVDLAFHTAGQVTLPPINFYGLALLRGGNAAVTGKTAAETHRLQEQAMLVHRPGSGFSYRWESSMRATLACVDPNIVIRAAREASVGDVDTSDVTMVRRWDPSCEHLIQVLASEAALPSHSAQSTIVDCVAGALACHILAGAVAARPAFVATAGALSARAFNQVRTYLHENLGERISLDSLAALVGISRFHFARQFRVLTGESPMGYLMRLRIERAKALLRASDTRVAEIAAALGFADQSHFTRTFRRMVGMSPTAFAGPRRASPALPAPMTTRLHRRIATSALAAEREAAW